MRKPWQMSKVETWGISIYEIPYAKGRREGGDTKCAHVHTRGRKVKKIGHNLHRYVLNG